MVGGKQRDVWQYGDFQTPLKLAEDVCELLKARGIDPCAILEPTCGRGAFVIAGAKAFPSAHSVTGVELNDEYADAARKAVETCEGAACTVFQGDFFATDWSDILNRDEGPWLILGNPPWVTNAELGALGSSNLPSKTNFQGHQGLDAITGKANFDISEWMLLEQLNWLRDRAGWIAMLVKTSVARKVLRQSWKRGDPVGRAAIFKIDAMRHFGAAVDACLFVLPVNIGLQQYDCDVYSNLNSKEVSNIIGYHDGLLLADVAGYMTHKDAVKANSDYVWRSGVKHDCSKIMELSTSPDGTVINGNHIEVSIEDIYVFPMLKSSDVANGRLRNDRYMIVTQRSVGESTSGIETYAPKTWQYLIDNADKLDARGSVIYKKKPRFSVFGVGDYTFSPWKIAVSAFYKEVRFIKVGPTNEKPIVFDDTIYFLSCWSEEEADFILSLVKSEKFSKLISAMMFIDEKRPITADLLKRISLREIADDLGMLDTFLHYCNHGRSEQLGLALA